MEMAASLSLLMSTPSRVMVASVTLLPTVTVFSVLEPVMVISLSRLVSLPPCWLQTPESSWPMDTSPLVMSYSTASAGAIRLPHSARDTVMARAFFKNFIFLSFLC